MKAPTHHVIVVQRRGGPEVLEVAARELPEPGPGEARVKVLAAGVSGFDVMLRSRRFPGFTRLPYTPGEDAVGLVDKLGEGVTAFTVGQRVAGWTFGDGGCYAEFICTPADRLVPVPADLDSAEAVTLVVNYLTAAMAMHETATVHSGERILVHGAAGGVGSALIQLGAMAGLEMYGTASRHNHELVSAFGATPIDYGAEDFVKRIRALTDDGVDVVFDPIGGARQLLRSYRCLRKGGRLVMLGMAAASKMGTRIIPTSLLTAGALKLVPDGRRMPMAPGLEHVRTTHGDWYRATLAELLDNGAAGKLKPVVAERVPLLEAAKAHEIMARGGHAGKVVLIANE